MLIFNNLPEIWSLYLAIESDRDKEWLGEIYRDVKATLRNKGANLDKSDLDSDRLFFEYLGGSVCILADFDELSHWGMSLDVTPAAGAQWLSNREILRFELNKNHLGGDRVYILVVPATALVSEKKNENSKKH